MGIKMKRPHDVTACVVSVMVEPSGDMTGMKAARYYPGNIDVGIRSVNVAIMNLALENIIDAQAAFDNLSYMLQTQS